MTVYKVSELQNIDDPLLLEFGLSIQSMRHMLSALMQHILSQLESHPVTLPIRVALAIMDRVADGSVSIELLCLKNPSRCCDPVIEPL